VRELALQNDIDRAFGCADRVMRLSGRVPAQIDNVDGFEALTVVARAAWLARRPEVYEICLGTIQEYSHQLRPAFREVVHARLRWALEPVGGPGLPEDDVGAAVRVLLHDASANTKSIREALDDATGAAPERRTIESDWTIIYELPWTGRDAAVPTPAYDVDALRTRLGSLADDPEITSWVDLSEHYFQIAMDAARLGAADLVIDGERRAGEAWQAARIRIPTVSPSSGGWTATSDKDTSTASTAGTSWPTRTTPM
jgi:hypothetical protein